MKSRRMIAFAALFGAALLAAGLLARPAFADNPLVGTWRLVSFVVEDLDTQEQKQPLGQHPGGLEVFTPEGRYIFLVTAEGRQATKTETDRSTAFSTMFAQAGKYRVEGNKLVLTIELAKEPAVIGRELAYESKIEGNRRTTISTPARDPSSGHMTQATVVWERVTQ